MAKWLAIIVITSFVYACEEKDYFSSGFSLHIEPATTLVKDTSFHDQLIAAIPGNQICIAKFICKTVEKNYGLAYVTSYFEDSLSHEENIVATRVVIQRNVMDSVVLTDTGLSSWNWLDGFSLPSNATIPVKVYITVRAAVSGRITTKLEITHYSTSVSTDIVSGQTVTLY